MIYDVGLIILAVTLWLAPPLPATCSVSGRVTDDAGQPVPFAAVTALRDLLPSPVNGGSANQRGEFCIGELPPGAYRVRAFARLRPPSASPSCRSCCPADLTEFVPTFFDRPVTVARSQGASKVDIRMRKTRAYCLRAEVRNSQGALVSDAGMAIGQAGSSSTVFGEGGRFLITSLPPGPYELHVQDHRQNGRLPASRVVQVVIPYRGPLLVIRVP